MHPKLIDYIKIAKKEGHLCHINTNGILLDDDYINALLDSGLDSIKFSFQGIDKKSYEEMRQGANFATVINNIKKLHRFRGNNLLPFVNIGTTTTYETDEQINSFIDEMSSICDLVTVGRTKLEHIDVKKTKLNDTQKEKLTELKQKQSLIEKRFNICPEIFVKLNLDWDGQVSGCCKDSEREMIVGDLNKNTIAEIFHGKIINEYRDILSRNAYDEISLCRRCFDYMNIQSPPENQAT